MIKNMSMRYRSREYIAQQPPSPLPLPFPPPPSTPSLGLVSQARRTFHWRWRKVCLARETTLGPGWLSMSRVAPKVPTVGPLMNASYNFIVCVVLDTWMILVPSIILFLALVSPVFSILTYYPLLLSFTSHSMAHFGNYHVQCS